MKELDCKRIFLIDSQDATEESRREVAADRLERLNFQKILTGKNAEISFLEKALADQEQIRIKLELLCSEMAKKEESFFDGFVNALQRAGEFEAKADCLMADKKELQKKVDFLVRAKDQLAQRLSDARKKLNGKKVEEEKEVDPLHLKLEKEICDRNPPPLRSGGNGQKPPGE